MSLGDYNRKRNFGVTAEPPGRRGATGTGRSFVIQKHAARRLHYDFRLELNGVLKSWSVPKGPSFDPTARRLAVAVEDHPIDYGGFEGIIPRGQYGGGTVLLWDRGTWAPVGDAAAGLAAGHLKFDLFGEKLQGRWALVRLKARPNRRGSARDDADRNWLLIKDRDAHARPEADWDVTVARPDSVASGRDLQAIAVASDRVWHSKTRLSDAAGVPGARPQAMPETLRPVLAKRARTVPAGDAWIHEVELAGERVQVRANEGYVHLVGQDGHDATDDHRSLAQAAKALPLHDAIIDGVATALGPDGRTRADLPATVLYLIDLPYLDGNDLTRTPLVERKQALAGLLSRADAKAAAALRFADHVVGGGPETFSAACGLGAPGVVSKRAAGPYRTGSKAGDWRVIRCPAATSKPASPRAPSGPASPQQAPPPSSRSASAPRRTTAEVRVATVKLTHPERMLYPEAGVTKLDLARYYEDVAAFMLPHLVDRPLTLVRSPEGMGGQPFYVRHAGPWAPPELRQFKIASGTGAGITMIAEDAAGLVALAQMNVLEIHAWNARVSRLELPDRMVFDLDPGPQVRWPAIVEGARRVRAILEQFELASFVKTTGSKGLHVVVPLTPHASWSDTLAFSRAIAQAIARAEPARYSAGLAKAGREDKIFVDYLRNRRGATSVSVYSTRGRPSAPASVPVAWDRLGTSTRSDGFHVTDRSTWLARRPADPWAAYGMTRQKLTARDLAAAEAVARDLTKTPR